MLTFLNACASAAAQALSVYARPPLTPTMPNGSFVGIVRLQLG